MNRILGDIIKEIRSEKGLSQLQFAKLLFVDRSTVAGWETGRRTPDTNMIMRISGVLDIDSQLLLDASLKEEEPDPCFVMMVDDEKIVLAGGIPVLQNVLPNADIRGFTKPSDAILYAKECNVSLAFLDIEIGKTSGLKLCDELLGINPNMNIIFLTAYMEYSFNAWSTGACGFLLKPINEQSVSDQLSRLRHPLSGGLAL
ncbi:MAG: response regulator [Eubacterium sp.]|nr:response regulator [Eubacterium sp.]